MRHKEYGTLWTVRTWGRHYAKDVSVFCKGDRTKICTSPESAQLAVEDGWRLVSVFKYGKKRQLVQQPTLRKAAP